MRDSERGPETEELDADEAPDCEAAVDAFEWFRGRGEGFVFEEEEEFEGYAVALEGLDAHYEEQACKHALRNEVQHDEKWACHCAEG